MSALTNPSPRPELSLVFPVFDEEENIGQVIEQALQIGSRLAERFEIVVVDDGSQDGSPRIIEAWTRADSRIRSLRHPRNGGYGAALRSGLRGARGNLVFFSDADLQFDLNELEKLLDRARETDIVAGYRAPRRDPWHRRGIAWVWGVIVSRLFGLRIRDVDCAFKVFDRRVLEAIPISSVGAFINTEILVRATAAGFSVEQVPVTHRRRRHGRQTGAHPRVLARALLELFSLHGELRRRASGR